MDSWYRENFPVFTVGVAPVSSPVYDPGMIVENLLDVVRFADAQAGGIPWHSDPFLAGRIGEDIAAVIVRNAFGQGLKYGDDWGWILEMYTPAECRKIAEESVRAARGRRRR